MATARCEKCKRAFEIDEARGSMPPNSSGCFVDAGTQWADDDCRHCHFCLYDDCEVFLRHRHWLCNDCRR